MSFCKQRPEQSDRYAPFHLAIALGGKKQNMLLPVTRARSKICLQRGSIKSVYHNTEQSVIFIPFSDNLLEHKPIRVALGVRGKQAGVMLHPS
jgi:hypothetical protein